MTDAAGRFRIAGLAPGTYDVVAVRDERAAEQPVQRLRPGDVAEQFTLTLEPWPVLAGRVLVGERPVADAHVTLVAREFGFRRYDVVTGADGRFKITPVSRTAMTVEVSGHEVVAPALVLPGDAEVTIQLRRRAVLSGKVVTAAGAPQAPLLPGPAPGRRSLPHHPAARGELLTVAHRNTAFPTR